MSTVTLDIEGNGLRPEADTVWCACALIHEDGSLYRFYDTDSFNIDAPDKVFDNHLSLLPEFLEMQDNICMHNGIEYDSWLIKKVMGYSIPEDKITDTLILSQLLDPQRKVPPGWVGVPAPHSVEAWAMRFGKHKVEHEDWSKFSEDMLIRCEQDVYIQSEILNALYKEVLQ